MATPIRLRDGGLTVALLILVAGLEGVLKVWPVDWTIALRILAGAALGLLAAWLGLALLLHLVARMLLAAAGVLDSAHVSGSHKVIDHDFAIAGHVLPP